MELSCRSSTRVHACESTQEGENVITRKNIPPLLIVTLFVFCWLIAANASTTTKTHAQKKAATTTSDHAKKSAAEKPVTHGADAHKAALTTTTGDKSFENVTGHVVKADIATNTLVLDNHGKDMKFSVPGRINMLDLKTGERVTAEYMPEGRSNRLWQLRAN